MTLALVYKQKSNIYLLTKELFKYGFKNVRWSFFESGYGKGTPDAVGGSLKREADRKVHHDQDITCAKDFVDKLTGCKPKLWIVASTDITTKKNSLMNIRCFQYVVL